MLSAEKNIPDNSIFCGEGISNTPNKTADGDFEIENDILLKYNGCSESVTVFDVVLCIYDEAFRGCTSLKSIVLTESLTEICDHAFTGCTALEGITLPKNLELIERGAFEDCTALKSVIFTGTGDSFGIGIGDSAFAGCTSLKTVTSPKTFVK